MSLRDMIFGKQGEIKAMPTMSGEQSQLFQQLLGGLGGPMQQGLGNLQSMLSGDASAFEAPAMRQFQEQIIPQLSEMFSGAGAGSQSSSAFQQSLGSAGAGLAENLAMQRAGLQQQGFGNLASLLGMGIQTPTFQYQNIPGTQGMLNPLFQGLGSGVGQMGGMMGAGWLGKKLGFFGG